MIRKRGKRKKERKEKRKKRKKKKSRLFSGRVKIEIENRESALSLCFPRESFLKHLKGGTKSRTRALSGNSNSGVVCLFHDECADAEKKKEKEKEEEIDLDHEVTCAGCGDRGLYSSNSTDVGTDTWYYCRGVK